VKSTERLLVPSLRMSGSIPLPLPTYFVAFTGTTLPFHLTGQFVAAFFMNILLSIALTVRQAQLAVQERKTSSLPF
jgi:hypothetical protein